MSKISLKKELLQSGDYIENTQGKLQRIKFDGKDHLAAQQRYRANVHINKKKKANRNACRSSANRDW